MSVSGASSQSRRTLSTGSSTIDSVLGGGLRTGVLTEVCGESGTGISNFYMQFVLSVRLAFMKQAGPLPCTWQHVVHFQSTGLPSCRRRVASRKIL